MKNTLIAILLAIISISTSCTKAVYVSPPKDFVFIDTNLYKDTLYFLLYSKSGDSSEYRLSFAYYKAGELTSYWLNKQQIVTVTTYKYSDSAWHIKQSKTMWPFFNEPVNSKIKKGLYFDQKAKSFGNVELKSKDKHKEGKNKILITSKIRTLESTTGTYDFMGQTCSVVEVSLINKSKTKYKLFDQKYKTKKQTKFKYICGQGLGVIANYTDGKHYSEIVDTLSKSEFIKLYKLLYMPQSTKDEEK